MGGGRGGEARGRGEAAPLQYVSEETRAPTYGGELTWPWPLATPPPGAGELERVRETIYQLPPPTTPAPQTASPGGEKQVVLQCCSAT